MAKKTITPINDVRVTLIGKPTADNLQEAVCTYQYKGKNINYFVFVEREKGKSDAKCIEDAKKEFKRLQKQGNIETYSNRYVKGDFSGGAKFTGKNLAIAISASVIAAGALVTGGIFIGKAIAGPISAFRPTVTFNAAVEGAHFGSDITKTKISIQVDKGSKVSDFIDAINVPTLEYNDFRYWTLEGSEIERDYEIYEDTNLDAAFAAQKTTIYLEAGGDGYGTLTPYTKQQYGTRDAIDMVNVVSFEVDRGSTLLDALFDEDGNPRYKPDIYRVDDAKKTSYDVKGWSLDGGTTYIDINNPEHEPLLRQELVDDKYTLVAGYDLKGQSYSELTDFNPANYQTVVFNSDGRLINGDKTPQTGQWDYYNNSTQSTTYVKTLSLMVRAVEEDAIHEAIGNLSQLMLNQEESSWYDNPIGDYAGFDYWYDTNKEREHKKPDEITFSGGGKMNLSPVYTPHFVQKEQGANQDPWRAVINNANLGLDHLHNVYKEDVDNNTDFPGTLVGLERQMELDPRKIYNLTDVVVIGEAQDYAGAMLKGSRGGSGSGSGSSGAEKASDFIYTRPVALTFQFKYSNTGGLPNTIFGNYANTPYYISSPYSCTSGQIFNSISAEIRNNIKTVKKFISISKTPSGMVYDTIGLKTFDLGVSECTTRTTGAKTKNELRVDGTPNTYKYYESVGESGTLPMECNFWTRSQDDDTADRYYVLKSDNNPTVFPNGCNNVSYCQPAFCLGRA